jgi:hypothetical protein
MIYINVLRIKSGSLTICEIVNYSLNSHPLSSILVKFPKLKTTQNLISLTI